MFYDLLFLRILIGRFYDYGRLREEKIDCSVSKDRMKNEARLVGLEVNFTQVFNAS